MKPRRLSRGTGFRRAELRRLPRLRALLRPRAAGARRGALAAASGHAVAAPCRASAKNAMSFDAHPLRADLHGLRQSAPR